MIKQKHGIEDSESKLESREEVRMAVDALGFWSKVWAKNKDGKIDIIEEE